MQIKFAIFILAACLTAVEAKAQSVDVLQEMPQEDLLGVAFRTETEAFAVGKRGTIKRFDVGGSVTAIRSDVTNDLFDVYFFDELNGIIAGSTGSPGSFSLRTSDGGATWSAIANVTGTRIGKISSTTAIISDGTASDYWKTTDKGATWVQVTPNLPQFITFPAFNFPLPEKGFLTGSFYDPSTGAYKTRVYTSDDEGSSWTLLTDFDLVTATEFISSSVFTTDQIGFFVVSYSKVYKTADGGLTWSPVLISAHMINDIYENDGILFAVGTAQRREGGFLGRAVNTSLILRSGNQGASWLPVDDELFDYSDYAFNRIAGRGNRMFVVGNSSRSFHSGDNGSSWENVCGFGVANTVYFFNSTDGFAAGDGIYATHDGGAHWKVVMTDKGQYLDSDDYFQYLGANKIHFVGNQVGYVAGGSGQTGSLLKTGDGGLTWSIIQSGIRPWWDIFLFDEQNGTAIQNDAGGYYCVSTSDGFLTVSNAQQNFYGVTWRGANGIWFLNQTEGYGVAGGLGIGDKKIYKTTDGGLTWLEKYNAGNENGACSIHFRGQKGLFVAGKGIISRTLDGGNTWSNYAKVVNAFLNDVEFRNDNDAFVVGDGTILKTSDAGNSWSIFFTVPPNDFGLYYLRSIFFKDDVGFVPAEKRFFRIVSLQNQSITFDEIGDKTLGDASFTLQASSSSGLPIAYTSTSGKISITGSMVSLLEAGRASITARQPGSTDYAAAAAVTRSFCIKPPKPVIMIENNNTETPTLTSNSNLENWWYHDGTQIAIGPSIVAALPGEYTVKVAVDECENQSDPFLLIVTSTEGRGELLCNLYPNPATIDVNIDLSLSGENEITFAIMDLAGRPLVKGRKSWTPTLSIPVTSLSPGIYFLLIQQNQKVIYHKFTKH